MALRVTDVTRARGGEHQFYRLGGPSWQQKRRASPTGAPATQASAGFSCSGVATPVQEKAYASSGQALPVAVTWKPSGASAKGMQKSAAGASLTRRALRDLLAWIWMGSEAVSASAACLSDEDIASLQAIREGREVGFLALVERYQSGLVRLARLWSREQADAEDIVQETWLVMLQSLDRFEGRSSLRAWLCGILVNLGRARLRRGARLVPMSSLVGSDDPDAIEPAVDPARFWPEAHPWAGHWCAWPNP
jgi:hypothetical protein